MKKLHTPIAPSAATRNRFCVVHPRYQGKGKPRIRAGAKGCSCSEVYEFRQLLEGKNKVTETRILQITNDVSEDIDNPATVHELRETIRYWMLRHAQAHSVFSAARLMWGAKCMDLCTQMLKPPK